MGVVLRVDANEGIVPLDGRERTRKTLFDIPKDGPTQVDVVLDETHTTISWPAALVVVPNDIVVRRVRVCAEVPLNEVTRLLCSEAEEDVDPVNVTGVQPDRMARLGCRVTVLQEVVRHLQWTGHLARALQAENEEIKDETIVLEDESQELEASNQTVRVRVRHVLVRQDCAYC